MFETMTNTKNFIRKLHKFDAKIYFAGDEDTVRKIMACVPKDCLNMGVPMSDILQIYRQAVAHLSQNNRLHDICWDIIRSLHEVKSSCVETGFV